MKRWIIGLLVLGIAIHLINSQDVNDDDKDYEVKRFHVQSRQLDGRSTCVVTRRKRSTRQSNFSPQPSSEEDDEGDSEDQQMEMGINTGSGIQESTGLLIRDSDLAGNAGILVIQNGAPPNSPVLFELRPVITDTKNTYFEVDDENNPDPPNDQDFEDDVDEMENNDNRYQPNSDLDSDEYQEPTPIRRRVKPSMKPKRKRPSSQLEATISDEDDIVEPSKKKPKRPSSPPPRNQRKPSRRKNQNKNSNKKKNKKKKKNSNRKGSNSGQKEDNERRKKVKKRVNSSLNRNNRLGVSINKGAGENTVTNTVTTTQTGTANDIPDVNCIIINKPASIPTTQRPFWDILGRSTGDRQADRSFGLRKRIKHKLLG